MLRYLIFIFVDNLHTTLKNDIESINIHPSTGKGGKGGNHSTEKKRMTGSGVTKYFETILEGGDNANAADNVTHKNVLSAEGKLLCDNVVQSQHTTLSRCKQYVNAKMLDLNRHLGLPKLS